MQPNFVQIAALLWAAWVISWHLGALWRDRAIASAPRSAYRMQLVLAFAGFMLVFLALRLPGSAMWSVGAPLGWSMLAVTLAGFAFAWWARIHLGRLWHGGVSCSAAHRVIDSGPYAIVRHPIYTGLIAALAALAVLEARLVALAGAVLFALGFVLKARVEERFLQSEIGGYDLYRARVPMILPFAIRPR